VTSPAGIVRAARRPRDWQAPGPAPAAPREIVPGPGEDLCYLCGDWRILQCTDGHRWSLDDLVTAWFAAEQLPTPPDHILDLGSGIGSVLLMLAWRFPAAVVTGIEAQPLSVDLARRSIAWNGAADRCRVHLGDLRDDALLAAAGCVDLVTGTPPYLPIGTARESRRVQKGPCNFEHRGGIEAYCVAAARALLPSGLFVVCEQAAQEKRVHAAAHAAGLAVTQTLPVVPRAGKPPLFAVHAMRRSSADVDPVTLPALVVRERDGTRTTDFQRVREAMGLPP